MYAHEKGEKVKFHFIPTHMEEKQENEEKEKESQKMKTSINLHVRFSEVQKEFSLTVSV